MACSGVWRAVVGGTTAARRALLPTLGALRVLCCVRGGLSVPADLFFPFLPPLCAFFADLVEVVFLPPSAGLSVDPPVAWANDRVTPSSRVNAIVSSFFIQSPSEKISFLEPFKWGIIDVQHS